MTGLAGFILSSRSLIKQALKMILSISHNYFVEDKKILENKTESKQALKQITSL
jgi:hypothetical protein